MEELKGKRVLVTGGAGFIGSHIADKLMQLGAEVVIIDNLETGTVDNIAHLLDRVTFIEKDIRDKDALTKALDGVEYVSHQAALRSVPKSMARPLDYNDVNVSGTLALFVKAKECGVKRVAYASSSSVYGDRADFPEKEEDPAHPISPYATTKIVGEYYAYLFTKAYNLGVVSLRYFNVFGPRQSLENQYAVVVPKFITCILKKEAAPIYGDGNQERDFTYIDNVVDANIAALTKEGIGGEVFNIASSQPQSVNYLLEVIQGVMNTDIAPRFCEPRAGDVRKTHADIEKAKRLLGWKPSVNFHDGLKKTIEWFTKNYTP